MSITLTQGLHLHLAKTALPSPAQLDFGSLAFGEDEATQTLTVTNSTDKPVTITDAGGLSSNSSLAVTVSQTLTWIIVTPGTQALNENGTQQFAATAYDQFAVVLNSQPTFTWQVVSGPGSITGTVLYTAPGKKTGTATVQASAGGVFGRATVTIRR